MGEKYTSELNPKVLINNEILGEFTHSSNKQLTQLVKQNIEGGNVILKTNCNCKKQKIDKGELHKQICNDLNYIYKIKNNDYGDSFEATRKVVPNAILVRVADKYNRLLSLTSGTERMVEDEKIEDTLMDLANYCIMELVERKKEEILSDNMEDCLSTLE